MDSLQHTYNNETFFNIMKAQIRKYLDKAYADVNLVVDMERKVQGDVITIHKVHRTKILMKNYYFVEKITINRKEKTYKSCIDTFSYKEECDLSEKNGNVEYLQKYSVPFFMKSKKELAFKKGCEIIENIISQMRSNNML